MPVARGPPENGVLIDLHYTLIQQCLGHTRRKAAKARHALAMCTRAANVVPVFVAVERAM